MTGPETTQSLATHLRRMADDAGDQIDTDRLSRAADLVEAPQAPRVKPLVWCRADLSAWGEYASAGLLRYRMTWT